VRLLQGMHKFVLLSGRGECTLKVSQAENGNARNFNKVRSKERALMGTGDWLCNTVRDENIFGKKSPRGRKGKIKDQRI